MNIRRISLQNFRNIELARLDFGDANAIFFHGANGQGKSNMLEALHLVSSMRSFRCYDYAPLIRKGQREARLIYGIEDEKSGLTEVEISITNSRRKILVDGSPIRQMHDFLGKFPSVVFSNDDVQLIKTSPQNRRRYFDLMFSILDGDYLRELQCYHRALKERNAALKSQMARSVVSAYDSVLIEHGLKVIQFRNKWTGVLQPVFENTYQRLATEETSEISYRPQLSVDNESAYLSKLEQSFERDRVLGSTGNGPHRDDFGLDVKSMGAKTYASDGQQRSLVLALKLSQAVLIQQTLKQEPIFVLDDILGELDSIRKQKFWSLVSKKAQLWASGTEIPSHEDSENDWVVYSVANGVFHNQ